MKKFTFKLEPLFELRKRLEELSQRDFAEALRNLEEEESRLRLLKGMYAKASGEVDDLKEKGAPVEDITMYMDYLQGVKIHIAGQEEIIKKFRDIYEARRNDLLEASKNKKVIEIIKERTFNAFMTEMDKLEQKALDDIVTSRFKRSGNNGL